MKIETLMTSDVRTCRANDSLSAAAQAMWESDLGCLPVVDDSNGVVGILTDRDLLMASHLRGAPLWMIAVREAMASCTIPAGIRAFADVDPVDLL